MRGTRGSRPNNRSSKVRGVLGARRRWKAAVVAEAASAPVVPSAKRAAVRGLPHLRRRIIRIAGETAVITAATAAATAAPATVIITAVVMVTAAVVVTVAPLLLPLLPPRLEARTIARSVPEFVATIFCITIEVKREMWLLGRQVPLERSRRLRARWNTGMYTGTRLREQWWALLEGSAPSIGGRSMDEKGVDAQSERE